MRPIDSINTMKPVTLWGPQCGHFIGTVAMVAEEEADEFPPGAKYYYMEDECLRDDWPDVEQWEYLPVPDGYCMRCMKNNENVTEIVTPLGYRFVCFPTCDA